MVDGGGRRGGKGVVGFLKGTLGQAKHRAGMTSKRFAIREGEVVFGVGNRSIFCERGR